MFADVLPQDRAILPDDEHCRSGHPVAQEVVHAVAARRVLRGVGQDGELRSRVPCHLDGVINAVDADGNDLDALVSEPLVRLLQLAELPATYASEEAAIEDEDHGLVLLQQPGESDLPTVGAFQGERRRRLGRDGGHGWGDGCGGLGRGGRRDGGRGRHGRQWGGRRVGLGAGGCQERHKGQNERQGQGCPHAGFIARRLNDGQGHPSFTQSACAMVCCFL